MAATFKDLLVQDLDAAMTTDEWAVDISYTPSGQAALLIPGIWDQTYEAVDPDTGAVVQSKQPKVTVKEADLAGVTPGSGDLVEVLGKSYRVIEYQPDGQGLAEIYLHRT